MLSFTDCWHLLSLSLSLSHLILAVLIKSSFTRCGYIVFYIWMCIPQNKCTCSVCCLFCCQSLWSTVFFFPAVVQQVSPSCKGTAVLWTAPPQASLIERCKEEPFTHERPITEQRTCCCPIRRQDGPETTRLFSYIFFHICALSLDCQVELPSRLHNKLCSFNNNICREWVWVLCANRCLKRLA